MCFKIIIKNENESTYIKKCKLEEARGPCFRFLWDFREEIEKHRVGFLERKIRV